MSDKDRKRPRDEGRDAPRIGSVTPEDADLATWLARFWTRSEYPERIEVWQVFGRNKLDRGEMVFHENFKPNDKLDPERVVKLANEMIEAAQNDCDCSERKRDYQIAVVDFNRKSSPLIRRLGPLSPKRSYLVKSAAHGGGHNGDEEEDGDDLPLNIKSLDLARIKEANDQTRWDKQLVFRVLGEVLTMQRDIAMDLRTANSQITQSQMQMMQQQMDFFMRLQDAEDRRLDRDVRRKKEELKSQIIGDLFATLRNVLPGLVAKEDDTPAMEGQPQRPKIKAIPPERMAVDNFLRDCVRETEDLLIPLFGKWEKGPDGNGVLVEPGIFSKQQFALLVGVQDGQLPVDALDALLPESGSAEAVTPDQLNAAFALPKMTTAIMLSVQEILKRRQSARAAANQTQTVEG